MKKYNVLNVPIWDISENEFLNFIKYAINSKMNTQQIATVNPEFICESEKNQEFKKLLNSTALNVADATGIIWAIKFLYKQKIQKIPGSDISWKIFKFAEQNQYKIFLLGGMPNVAKKAAKKIIEKYPQIKIVGTSNKNPNDPETINIINKSRAEILFVAYGTPKQEFFISQNLNKLNARIAIGVGGTFDFIAGIRKRAPKWVRKIGLEWLYRLFQEPKRIKRIYNAVIKFPYLVIKSK
jgi:N-acetylglucosaminyldiphosphoundecaprenol N-acetyl-beta-D-mannosaminyltransferase